MISKFTRAGRLAALALSISAIAPSSIAPAQLPAEAQRLIDMIMAPPPIRAEPGFRATMLVPPGELYDPLYMVPRDGAVWMNDDGKASNENGSRILSVALGGAVTTLFDADAIRPVVGFDVAPAGFGAFEGQIFALSQPTTGMVGGLANHIVQRIDPKSGSISTFCLLPSSGSSGNGAAGFGAGAAFGPPGTAFAGTFFSITVLNRTIYRTRADGSCAPFADLTALGPIGLTFSPDGKAMYVSGTPAEPGAADPQPRGRIVRIGPDGTVDPVPVATGLTRPMGMATAPAGFGAYGGEIFVLDSGLFEIPVPMTQALARDGKLYRITRAGELKLVASGFVNPSALRFVGNQLWVTDVNGDFIGGGRELPDGFVVRIELE